MDLEPRGLISLEEARSLGEELEWASEDQLRANRDRLLSLEHSIVQCERVRQRVGHAQLVYVRAFLKTGAWRLHGMRTAADWVAWRLGLDARTARERIRVAHALDGLPRVDAALAAGEINYTKARAIARVASGDDEEEWLEKAVSRSADQLERECRETPLRPQGEDEGRDRWIVSRTRPDGMVQTTIVLPPEESALFFKSLDAAITLAHSPKESRGSDGPEPDGSDGPERFGRADALVAVSNHFLASQPSPASSPGRYEVQVRVDSALLESRPPVCELIDGTPLEPETARRLSCDAAKVEYRADSADYPMDVDRRTRTVPAALKRALILRDDGRCRFPGCDAHLFVESHHLVHWADGGPTHLANLILLCSRHHTWTHEGGGEVTVDEDGAAVFLDAFGDELPYVPALEEAA
jgi:hypothetical protein